jgi:type II secretory pathway component GspD/PulD (secretin)
MTDQPIRRSSILFPNVATDAIRGGSMIRRAVLLIALAGTVAAVGMSEAGAASGMSQEPRPAEPTPAPSAPPAKVPELPNSNPNTVRPVKPGAGAPAIAPGATTPERRRPDAPAQAPGTGEDGAKRPSSGKQPDPKAAPGKERLEAEEAAKRAAEAERAKQKALADGASEEEIAKRKAMEAEGSDDEGAKKSERGDKKADPDAEPPAEPATPGLPGTRGEQMAGSFRYGPFAEPVKIKLIADEVASFLGIQYIGADAAIADKQVFLPTALDVPADQLMEFLGLLLEQNGMVLKSTGIGKIYQIAPAADIGSVAIDQNPLATTQIIPTPGIKPSSLQPAITAMGARGGGGGAAAGGGGAAPGSGSIAYLDELGVILITDSPRRIAIINSLVKTIVAEQGKQEFTRFNIEHISAATARQRMIDLLGRGNAPASGQPGQPNPGAQGGGSTTIANLPERLTLEPTSNAILFRGRNDETALLNRLLRLVDVPSVLEGKWYAVSGAAQIAQSAEEQGFGRVVTIQVGGNNSGNPNNPNQIQPQFNPGNPGGRGGAAGLGGEQGASAGPTILVDGQGRGFMYIATKTLHAQMDKLVKDLEPFTESEAIVYEHYKVKHSKSEDIAEIVRSLISNTVPAATSALLPGASQSGNFGGSAFGNRNSQNNPNQSERGRRTDQGTRATNTPRSGATGADGENLAIEASSDVFVLADQGNSQVIVKAPKRLQPQFARLITKLDLRRPQVFIEAQIVVIDDNDNWRLAFESQYVQATGNGTTVAARGIFGSATAAAAPAGGGAAVNTLTGVPVVNAAANAFTAAVIKSDQVPLVITALQNSTNARIVASPKLLVDDNEESEISALRQVPTTTTSQSGAAGSTVTSFGGFEDAGPRLRVKPQISSGDYLRLEYALELSSFIGTVSSNSGVPPAKSTTTITSDSVTVPSDSTIIVGGLTLEDVSNTVLKLPFIGDIPILGQLFRDESETKSRRVIYVFITPRVMRDVTFNDVRLISQGPMIKAKVTGDTPEMMPSTFIDGAGSKSSPVRPLPGQADPATPTTPGTPPAPASTTPSLVPIKDER